MVSLNAVEIMSYRAELAADPDFLSALDVIEDCEGDVEDAAIALALHVGQEPDRSGDWLDGLAKRWRVNICTDEFRTILEEESIAHALRSLTDKTAIPPQLAVPVVIYVLKTGIANFCKPLEELL
jgi:hypothetical protein